MQENMGKLVEHPMLLSIDFKRYIHDKLSVDLYNLKANMDDESCLLIDNLIKKLFALYGSRLLLLPDLDIKTIYKSLSTKEELKTIENPDLIFKDKEYLERKTKYSLGKLYETGFWLSGLRYLDDDIVTKNLKNRDIIDGGAFDGETALVFSDLSPKQVYAFEPVTKSYNDLTNNIAKYDKKNIITPVKYGLSDQDQTLPIASGYGMGASIRVSTIETAKANEILVESIDLTTVDKYAKAHDLDVGLIKLDIEGAEYATIMGAKQTIIANKPILLISAYHSMRDFLLIKPFLERLNLNYKFMFRKLITTPRQDFGMNATNHSLDERILNISDYMLICYVDDNIATQDKTPLIDTEANVSPEDVLNMRCEINDLKAKIKLLEANQDQK